MVSRCFIVRYAILTFFVGKLEWLRSLNQQRKMPGIISSVTFVDKGDSILVSLVWEREV